MFRLVSPLIVTSVPWMDSWSCNSATVRPSVRSTATTLPRTRSLARTFAPAAAASSCYLLLFLLSLRLRLLLLLRPITPMTPNYYWRANRRGRESGFGKHSSYAARRERARERTEGGGGQKTSVGQLERRRSRRRELWVSEGRGSAIRPEIESIYNEILTCSK